MGDSGPLVTFNSWLMLGGNRTFFWVNKILMELPETHVWTIFFEMNNINELQHETPDSFPKKSQASALTFVCNTMPFHACNLLLEEKVMLEVSQHNEI